MTDVVVAAFWIALGCSALLTWFGISQSSSRALFGAAGLAALAAVPAAFSIGPFILLAAVLQLVAALIVRHNSMHGRGR